MRRPPFGLAAAAALTLAGCGGAPPPPPPPAPAPDDAAALPLPVEPAPQVPLPGENGRSPSPMLGRALLPNGLNVVLLRAVDDKTRTARFALQIAAGADNGKPGAADLAADLFVHGADLTAGRPSLRRQIERLGGTLSIELGPSSTWFTVRIDQDRWRPALAAVAAALGAPPPSRGMLERAQQELLQQRTETLTATPVVATAERLLLGDQGSGDHLASLRDRDPSEGIVFASRNYRPDHAVLVLQAPDDPKAIDSVVRAQFTPWAAAKVAPDPQQGPHQRALAPGIHWQSGGKAGEACRFGLVFLLPDPLHRDAPAQHLLLHTITMDGLGGRLERLMLENGLGDVAFAAHYLACGEATALVLTATATPQRTAQIWQLANRARNSLRDLPPTGSERALARSRTWLSLRRGDVEDTASLRTLLLRVVANIGEDQLLERLTDLEQPDAITGTITDSFLALPFALVAVGGEPPAELDKVQRFDGVETAVASNPATGGEQLVAAARPWLDQALQAIGGADRVRRIGGLQATMNVHTEGAPDLEETFQWTLGSGLKRTRTVLGAAIETTITGNVWLEQSGTEKVSLSPLEAAWRLGEIERHPLALLAAYCHDKLRFRLLAMQTQGDREMVLLEAVTDRFERLRIQVDRQSGLVRTVESWNTSPDGLPSRIVDQWTDYRTVDGIRVPFRRETTVDDGQSHRVAEFARVQPLQQQ